MKLRNNKIRIIIRIFIYLSLIYIYITLFINTNLSNYINSEISSKYNIDFNIKDKLLYNSLNKIVSLNDLDNINNVKSVSKVKEEITTDNIIYIYNSHDTEKYSLPFISDYSIVPSVKISSYILKDHLNDLGIPSYVEEKSINSYLKKHNLSYYYSYDVSRTYIKEALKKVNYKILIDIHRDSVKRKYTLYEEGNMKYAKVMFVLSTKHKNYKKNYEFVNYLNNKINKKYKGLSRGIMKRKDVIFNQDLSNNAILIEVGGVDNTILELNNTLEVIALILKDYIKEKL